jgi:hypothetical protein
MPSKHKKFLSDIKKFGIDEVVDTLNPDDIENITIKCIVRTIKESKTILVETLEELIKKEQEEAPSSS